MPTLHESIITARGLTGYGAASSTPKALPAPAQHEQPIHNTMLRCPLPTLWQSTPDSLRQFYLQGQVPQMRVMTPR